MGVEDRQNGLREVPLHVIYFYDIRIYGKSTNQNQEHLMNWNNKF